MNGETLEKTQKGPVSLQASQTLRKGEAQGRGETTSVRDQDLPNSPQKTRGQVQTLTKKEKVRLVRQCRDTYLMNTGLRPNDFSDRQLSELVREGMLVKKLNPEVANKVRDDAIWARALFYD